MLEQNCLRGSCRAPCSEISGLTDERCLSLPGGRLAHAAVSRHPLLATTESSYRSCHLPGALGFLYTQALSLTFCTPLLTQVPAGFLLPAFCVYCGMTLSLSTTSCFLLEFAGPPSKMKKWSRCRLRL